MSPRSRPVFRAALAASLAASTVGVASAQTQTDIRFSLDAHGPSMGAQATGSTQPITDADILVRSDIGISPLESPRILVSGDFLAAYASCAGHPAGVACGLEINAISGGRDARLRPNPNYTFSLYLSVDEFAVGRPLPPTVPGPGIFGEALANEAAADVFTRRFVGSGPFAISPGFSVGIADGDGERSSSGAQAAFGLGVIEPIPPTIGGVDEGDNVDAIDLGRGIVLPSDPIWFSLEGGFPKCNEPAAPVFDAAASQLIAGMPASSADVLVLDPAITADPVLYAAAGQLGLDSFGRGTDDLDALVVVENGEPGFQPPNAPYSWVGANPTDLVLFSIRCGSQTIGQPDSNFGIPISEGDVLIYLGTGQFPGVFVAAEAMGLETTSRGGPFDDELDGLDIRDGREAPFKDCNMNGVEDSDDINSGSSDDCDANGIPDECEDDWVVFCDCAVPSTSPCGNAGPAGAGCLNNAGTGATMGASGTTSVFSDALVLEFTDMNPNTFAVVFMGDGTVPAPVGNGRRCVSAGPQGIFRLSIEATGMGSFSYGPGILADAANVMPSAPNILIGSTWAFQAFYRDPGPCNAPFAANFTNGLLVPFTP